MDKAEVQKIFQEFSDKKILIVGDVMIDSYLWGKVERISPEAPVPIVSTIKKEMRLGGAANVALNIQALGATPLLCGIIGNNDHGTDFLALMQENHLENDGIYIVAGRPTTVKTRIIGGNQHLIRIDEETDKPISGKDECGFIDHIREVIENYSVDAVIFQDYDKGALTPTIINHVIALAKEYNVPTLVDPKKRNFQNYAGVTLFKPNFKEFCEGMKIDLAKDRYDKIFEAAKEFQNHKHIEFLMITLSEKGVLISNKQRYWHIPAHLRDITDVSGAGDTVISVTSLCMAAALSPELTAAMANLAGGLVCEKVGVVPIDKDYFMTEVEIKL